MNSEDLQIHFKSKFTNQNCYQFKKYACTSILIRLQDSKNILSYISKLRFFKPKKSTWESFTVCIGGKLNIIIVSSLFLLCPIYNVYSVRKEVLYFLFIFCVEVQQWNSFSCMFLWLFFSIISRLVFLPSSISSFMRHKNWSNSEVHKQKIS